MVMTIVGAIYIVPHGVQSRIIHCHCFGFQNRVILFFKYHKLARSPRFILDENMWRKSNASHSSKMG
jgi:hypothetical protein